MLIILYAIIFILLILYLWLGYKSYKIYKVNSQYIIDQQERNEGFVTNNYLSIKTNNTLINKAQFIRYPVEFKNIWRSILLDYISNFNDVNLHSRNVRSHDELLNKYMKCLLPISDDNINTVNNALSKAILQIEATNRILLKYVMNIIKKVKIIKVSNDMEGGYPHTYKNYIIFPESWFRNISITTFIHELVHIDQRLRPNLYYNLYNSWCFSKYNLNEIDNMKSIINQNRVNPDGLDINWIWHPNPESNKSYWIGALFNHQYKPNNIADVKYLIITLKINKTGKKLEIVDKEKNISSHLLFNDYFGNINNNHYHPNEIVAEYMSILYSNMDELYSNVNKLHSCAYNIFIKWMNDNI